MGVSTTQKRHSGDAGDASVTGDQEEDEETGVAATAAKHRGGKLADSLFTIKEMGSLEKHQSIREECSTTKSKMAQGAEQDGSRKDMFLVFKENPTTEDKGEVEKYEHIRVLILSSMASKLQGISTDVVEMTNEHPVSFAVSQPKHCLVSPAANSELLGMYVVIAHLVIIIVALVFDQMISRHYKKVQRYPSPQVEPSPSPHEMSPPHELKNLGCSMPKREVTEVQRYPFPIGIRNLLFVMPSRSKRACFRCSRSRALQFLKPERDCLAQKRLQILKQQILLCH